MMMLADSTGSGGFWTLVIVGCITYAALNWEDLFGGGSGSSPPAPGPGEQTRDPPDVAATRVESTSPSAHRSAWPHFEPYDDLPSVRSGKPKFAEPYLSATRVKVWDRCRHRFRLEYVDKLPPWDEESEGLKFGTVVHETLETVFKWVQENGYRGDLGSFEVFDVMDRAHSRALSRNRLYPNAASAAMQRCEDYLDDEFLGPHDEVLHVETPVTVNIKPERPGSALVRLAGIPDLVMRRSKTLVEIVDFKTHRRVLKKEDLVGDVAQAVYAMWARTAYPTTTIHNTYALLKHERTVSHEFSADELRGVRNSLRRIDWEISTARQGAVFPPTVELHCFDCPMRHHCDHFDRWRARSTR